MNKIRTRFFQVSIVAIFIFAANPHVTGINSPLPPLEPTKNEIVAAEQEQWLNNQLGDGLDERDRIASQVVSEQFVKQISAVEWLAPLAPIALSPFFGITLLSGLACYGPDWLPDNALLSDGSPLANPTMFWLFLVLTVITSLPRFSKVSKPVAQLADFLETYSAIVILLVLKIVAMSDAGPAETGELVPVEAGILAAGWEVLIMVAMVINIIVVNTVKFFFEFLVWITPIPFLDACFEIANKAICVGLMAVYAFSPIVALILNLTLFVACAIVFVWIKRREVFYRTMLLDFVLKSWRRLRGGPVKAAMPDHLTVFPIVGLDQIPAKARCTLSKSGDNWNLMYRPMFRSPVILEISGPAELKQGWWTNTVDFGHSVRLTFSCRYNDQIPELAEQMQFAVSQPQDVELNTRRKVEFA